MASVKMSLHVVNRDLVFAYKCRPQLLVKFVLAKDLVSKGSVPKFTNHLCINIFWNYRTGILEAALNIL